MSSPLLSRLHSPISCVTAYDYPAARLCDEAGVQLILVGDSLGMVVAGNPDTTSVTLEHMIYHTEMVRRGVKEAVLVSDLPFASYETPEQACSSAQRLVKAGADAVKLEGGLRQVDKVEAMRAEGIEVCGHLGMLPQRVREEGGYKKKGKSDEEAEALVEAAKALEAAGVFAIVLESMVAEVAARVTEATEIPTIGIGAGTDCDGQIRVLHDVVGAYPWFVPPFATVYGDVAGEYRTGLAAYLDEVSGGKGA